MMTTMNDRMGGSRTAPAPLVSGVGFFRSLLIPRSPNPSPTGGQGRTGFAMGQFPLAPAWERGAGGAGPRVRANKAINRVINYA